MREQLRKLAQLKRDQLAAIQHDLDALQAVLRLLPPDTTAPTDTDPSSPQASLAIEAAQPQPHRDDG